MTAARILGVDPGLDGALALVVFDTDTHRVVSTDILDMPTATLAVGRGLHKRRTIALPALVDAIRVMAPDVAYVEKVGPGPRNGSVQSFAFGYGFGVLRGILASASVPVLLIQPQVWRPRVGLNPHQGKGASLARARELHPLEAYHFIRQKDDGRAEAVLIARAAYAIHHQTQSPVLSTSGV